MDDALPVPSLDPARFKLGSESDLAYWLKWEAWEWPYSSARCRCIGLEVRLQGPWGAVVDVVGIGPGNAIYVVEVKASRADFARDNHTEADIDRLRKRQDALDRRIQLARAPGYLSSNGDSSRLEQEAERLRERLATVSTKFHDPRFLAIADYHYLMAPRGVVLAEMLPPDWGLLEQGPVEIVAAPEKDDPKKHGHRVQRASRHYPGECHGDDAGAWGHIWYGGRDVPTIRLQRNKFPTRSHAAGRKHGRYVAPGGSTCQKSPLIPRPPRC